MTLNVGQRRLIAKDTIHRSPAIVAEHKEQGASADSIFIQNQLPALDPKSPSPGYVPSAIEVINSDSFAAARQILANDPGAAGRTAVLNLASDILPAGPWLEVMTTTQEEALCYSSTLYITLKESYYPWPNLGEGCVAGVYSPGVVIFRDELDKNCVELPLDQRRVISVLTVAAPAWPDLSLDGQAFRQPSTLTYLQEKIRLVYRMAAHNGQENLVLGAMGCGAYACPPRLVATQMRDILLEPEFRGWFKKVVFAIYSRPTNGPGNFEIFEDVFKGVEL
ncbi:hypothetical protein MSAN_00207100 [Mycena sanguinolenta]|uniref:Microbial-type PARG catalytic domain-containing protein n=1 Tax=Mycena sanguinolenta TaxID=230812 RepID=A0A8H6ZJ23_9AGAR|nr:hypothetical protein MSAN_00207100 [Mycena sanguinolenta]